MENKSISSCGFTETVLAGSPADRPWEGCINSVVFRVPRGVKVVLPDPVALHIKRTEEERERALLTAKRLSSVLEPLSRAR